MAALADRRHMGCCRTETDQRLVEFARRGDVAAFEAIVLRYQEPLLRRCRRMLTPTEAEDAVQEAFLAAYRSINQTGPELRLGGWLFRIAHNAAVGILRRRVSTASLEGLRLVTESADAVMERQQQLRETLGALSNLPETERVALIERALAGRGHREIAVGLGRSEVQSASCCTGRGLGCGIVLRRLSRCSCDLTRGVPGSGSLNIRSL